MTVRRPGLLRTTRLAMLQLALAAMVLRALIPAGWMPNPAGAASGAALIICTGQGLQTIYPDGDGKSAPHRDQNRHHDICPFAAAGHLAPPTIASLALAPAFAILKGRVPDPVSAAYPAPINEAHRPRGPPHLV